MYEVKHDYWLQEQEIALEIGIQFEDGELEPDVISDLMGKGIIVDLNAPKKAPKAALKPEPVKFGGKVDKTTAQADPVGFDSQFDQSDTQTDVVDFDGKFDKPTHSSKKAE